MTKSEAVVVGLEVMDEYLPRTVTKSVRRSILHDFLCELEEGGAVDFDSEAEESSADDVADLTSLIR
jgi:hypothetical protein